MDSVYGDVPPADSSAATASGSREVERFRVRPGAKMFQRRVNEEGWIPQDWTFYLVPVGDGIELLWIVQTGDPGLPEFYGVQQCFRLTGTANEAWRQKYARTAAFSEFDLWQQSSAENAHTSLTLVASGGSLKQIPAGKETLGCRTPYGGAMDRRRSRDRLETLEHVGPYNARMIWKSDSGLIFRTSADRSWSTGICWERTTHVSVHHPADCLHAIVNIGGIRPHGRRVLRGRIYWLAGPGETLVEHWRKDFPKGD